MKEYNYTQITNFTNKELFFEDGTCLNLLDCREKWANDHDVDLHGCNVIGERNMACKEPYFAFCSEDEIKVVFVKRVLIWQIKQKREFIRFQRRIELNGYRTYDIS